MYPGWQRGAPSQEQMEFDDVGWYVIGHSKQVARYATKTACAPFQVVTARFKSEHKRAHLFQYDNDSKNTTSPTFQHHETYMSESWLELCGSMSLERINFNVRLRPSQIGH